MNFEAQQEFCGQDGARCDHFREGHCMRETRVNVEQCMSEGRCTNAMHRGEPGNMDQNGFFTMSKTEGLSVVSLRDEDSDAFHYPLHVDNGVVDHD